MKRALKWIVSVVIAVVIVVFLVLTLGLSGIVSRAVTGIGPKLTKTSIKLDEVSLSVLTGKGHIRGLEIGNPEAKALAKVACTLPWISKASSSVELRVKTMIVSCPCSIFSWRRASRRREECPVGRKRLGSLFILSCGAHTKAPAVKAMQKRKTHPGFFRASKLIRSR